MKVLLINGSPRAAGCTFTALNEVAGQLKEAGVEVEFFHIGTEPVRGCVACGSCYRKQGVCAFKDDKCNELIQKAASADGFVFGSPVYYAGPNGALCALLDRAFYAGSAVFAQKPGAVVVSCRRGGATAAFDRLNKYLTISQMPVVSSQYWNGVHGHTPDEVKRDLEGLQVMRTLGRNMAWLLKSLDGKVPPQSEERVFTNFIR